MRPQSPEQQLRFHTNKIYYNDGTNAHKRNSQGENTFTTILTLGDSHELCFIEFFSQSPDNQVGKNSDDIKLTLSHNRSFVLHPSDEMMVYQILVGLES